MAFAVGDVIDAIVQQAETWWLSNGLLSSFTSKAQSMYKRRERERVGREGFFQMIGPSTIAILGNLRFEAELFAVR